MHFPPPRPNALFSLIPISEAARKAVAHPNNRHLISKLEEELVIDVGPFISSQSRDSLATIGRAHCDITVEERSISRLQCIFELLPNGEVMLKDKTTQQTTQVWGDDHFPFECGRERKILVRPGLNTEIGMGGSSQGLVNFHLHWHCNDTLENVNLYMGGFAGQEDNPVLARTLDDVETIVPSRRVTTTHTPTVTTLKLRYVKGKMLGEGNFGAVRQAVDVDSGTIMALKTIKVHRGIQETIRNGMLIKTDEPEKEWHERWTDLQRALRREIEAIRNVKHVGQAVISYHQHGTD